jgi:hypothetical protein
VIFAKDADIKPPSRVELKLDCAGPFGGVCPKYLPQINDRRLFRLAASPRRAILPFQSMW